MMFMSLLFQENVMIVDSPGVGESEVMDEFVVNYLSICMSSIPIMLEGCRKTG